MNRDFALTLWRADLVRFGLEDRQLVTGKRLIAHHSGWLRRYHGLAHLAFLFQEIEEMREHIRDLPRLVYAAWFHDAIYKSWRKDNETRSADWARSALETMGAASELCESVHALIIATADHARGGQDQDDALFLDMDCAIMGATQERYDVYARQVRREYFWAPGGAFRTGRIAFLKSQLARDKLFHTEVYRQRLEAQARTNLERELKALSR